MQESYPRLSARTQRFTLGEPRSFNISPDGRRIVFVRSSGPTDPINALWRCDLDPVTGIGHETLVADPRQLGAIDDAELPTAERAGRERAREGAGGIVAYATDAEVRVASFALGGELYVAGLLSATARPLPVPGPVVDPRPDPKAERLAYVREGALCVAELDASVRTLASDEDPEITWGLASFIAGEEMGRTRGYWWSPSGTALATVRVDANPVEVWWIGDPAHPEREPRPHRYPAAGTANAIERLFIVGLDLSRTEVVWDRARYEYLVDVAWQSERRLGLVVMSRDQRTMCWLSADRDSGRTSLLAMTRDDSWVDIVPGGWGWLDDGRFVRCAESGGTRRILVDGVVVTGPDLCVRSVVRISGDEIVFCANELNAPEQQHVYRWTSAHSGHSGHSTGSEESHDTGSVTAMTSSDRSVGLHSATAGGPSLVIRTASLDGPRAGFEIHYAGAGPERTVPITSRAMDLPLEPVARFLRLGERRVPAVLLLPGPSAGRHGTEGKLPVLMDPYGGPHAQRVLASRAALQGSQWFADQGFAVLVVDGRGTPGLGTEWERAVRHDLAGPVLDDQVEALLAAAELEPRLDLDRVGIRGWSFGGYLAALAVLRRPDVFHAAVAGAPGTDWRLYDTCYTERYLGDPNVDAANYDRTSLIREAASLRRPLMLIHGLADDNVVPAHTLQLSSALLAAGRAHQVLPLTGVTHMTPQEVVAENLLLLQLRFLQESLGLRVD